MIKIGFIRWCSILPLLVLVIAGCSGSKENNPPTVSGVAAAGSALVGTVYLRDLSFQTKELSMPLAADGSFLFNLNGLTGPFMLKATGTANGHIFTLYSFTPGAGISNINPLSNLAMVLANNSDDLQHLYDNPDLAKIHLNKDSLSNAITSVQTALRPTLARFGAETVNFISDTYLANHKGIDLFLDNATITTINSNVTLFDRTTSNVVQTTLSGFKTGSFDFIANPVTTVGTVCISPTLFTTNANESKDFTAVVIGADQNVTWSVVEDNGGSITNSGLYTAPATAGTYHVKVTSTADLTKSSTATIVVRATPIVYLVSSGQGEYTVSGSNFFDVGGVQVTITYDTSTLANPSITQSGLLAATMFIPNLSYTPNSVKFAAISLSALAGSGTLAKIKFDMLGSAPNAPVITALKISSAPPPKLTSTPRSVVTGDVNSDGVVRLNDTLQVMRYIIGTQPPTEIQRAACDVASSSTLVTPDGVCDIVDAVMIMNKAYGIISF